MGRAPVAGTSQKPRSTAQPQRIRMGRLWARPNSFEKSSPLELATLDAGVTLLHTRSDDRMSGS